MVQVPLVTEGNQGQLDMSTLAPPSGPGGERPWYQGPCPGQHQAWMGPGLGPGRSHPTSPNGEPG